MLAPERGPMILFFSGGSAIADLSRSLKRFTHRSIHILTPFDSGGSSGPLRRAFEMIAVGDVRSRLVALADESRPGYDPFVNLMNDRFNQVAVPQALWSRFDGLLTGRRAVLTSLGNPVADIIKADLMTIAAALPRTFDLRGASIGNLILTGAYLRHGRSMRAAITNLSSAIRCRGTIRPVTEQNLDIAANLADGSHVLGQHNITDATRRRSARITSLRTVLPDNQTTTARAVASDEVVRLIEAADLICYPMGSFFSSVVANLLPSGVGKAIASNKCAKLLIPSTGHDHELLGLSLVNCVDFIVRTCRDDAGPDHHVTDFLTHVAIDARGASYSTKLDRESLPELGVQVVNTALTDSDDRRRLSAKKLALLLIDIAAGELVL